MERLMASVRWRIAGAMAALLLTAMMCGVECAYAIDAVEDGDDWAAACEPSLPGICEDGETAVDLAMDSDALPDAVEGEQRETEQQEAESQDPDFENAENQPCLADDVASVEEALAQDDQANSKLPADDVSAEACDEGASLETQAAAPPLVEGDYVIKSGVGSYVLDVAGASKSNGGNVQIYEYNGTNAQKWHISSDADGYYTLKSLASGKYLDVSGGKAANSTNIQQYEGNGTLAQKWLLSKTSYGYALVSAVNGSYVLDVSGGRAANGTNVQLYKANGTAAQGFEFTLMAKSSGAMTYDTPLAPGDYVIQSGVGRQYVLDVSGGSLASGANVQLYEYNGTAAQKWSVSYDANGLYTFKSVRSGMVLDLSGASAKNGSNIQQYTPNGTKAQKWVVTAVGSQFTITSAVDAMINVDVSGARAANSTNIQAYFGNGTKAQLFTFVSVAAPTPGKGDVADGVYTIAAYSNQNYVLDVSGASIQNGANVQLYQSNDTYAQRWGVVRGSDGWYTLFSMASGKVLDVNGGSPLPGTNVQQYASNDSKAQQWSIVKNSDNVSYTLVNAISGLALDIAGGKYANGTNIQVNTSSNSAAQKFSFIARPILEEGSYAVLTSCSPGLAVDVPGASVKDGQALQVYSSNDTLAQHIVVASVGDGAYTMRVVGSGKYLTDENGSITQRSAQSGKAQQWSVSLGKTGLLFKNLSTAKYMGVASSSPKDATKLTSLTTTGMTSTFIVKPCDLIGAGVYTFTSAASAAGRVLDVAAGSWNSGANVQLYTSNGTNAQKFNVAAVGDGYYKIALALSRKALGVAGGSKSAGANVELENWTGADAQLWKPVMVDNGLSFVNKGSGLFLEVAGGKDADGANVDQAAATSGYSQSWIVAGTSVNWTDYTSIARLVRSVSGSGSLTASFDISASNWQALKNALNECWSRDCTIGFLMTDLQSGNWVSINADRPIWGASTMKGAYVTWIFQSYLEPGYVSWDDVADDITATIVDSSNDAYFSLRSRFGSSGFNSWLGGVGLSGWGDEYYARYSPRDLQLMWVRILAYEQSGGRFVGTWRSTFSHSYYSEIRDELGGEKTTYTKPGWYPQDGSYAALNDSGIVIGSNGRRYLLTIESTLDCSSDQWIVQRVVRALNTIFDASPFC